jgi:hypothetical protein
MTAVILLFLSTTSMYAACVYQRDVTYVDWFDSSGYHSNVFVSYSLLYCDDEGGGGGVGGGGGGGGGNYGGGNLPYVNITSASDENPNQVTLDIYSINGATMTLYKDNSVVSSGPPANHGFFGSLDNMVAPTTTLTAEVCNDYGCSSDDAFVYRNSGTQSAEGAVQAWYNVPVPDSQGGVTIEHRSATYSRLLQGEFYFASYSVGTSGARNGRVQHVHSADALLWEDATTPPPVWVTTYRMTPYWSGQQIREEASGGPGCNVPRNQYPYSDVQCTTTAEFAQDGSAGEGYIEALTGVSFVTETLPPFGALDLTLNP